MELQFTVYDMIAYLRDRGYVVALITIGTSRKTPHGTEYYSTQVWSVTKDGKEFQPVEGHAVGQRNAWLEKAFMYVLKGHLLNLGEKVNV